MVVPRSRFSALGVTLCLLPLLGAQAFTIESSVMPGCHERITTAALAQVGWPLEARSQAAKAPSQPLVQTLPFHLPPGADGWTVGLLVGVRDNDLHGASLLQLPELAAVHNSKESQHEHCLRAPGHDHGPGDEQALADCKDYILRELEAALGEGEHLEVSAQEEVRVSLAYQVKRLKLPRYAYHLGRALHALQDSYSHSLRDREDLGVRHVFNYVESALSPRYDEERDGHPHVGGFDGCDAADEDSYRRAQGAIEASARLLAALNDPRDGRSGRLARARAVLDDTLAYTAGCTQANAWCGLGPDAEKYMRGCASAPGSSSASGLLLLGVGLFLSRRRSTRLPLRAAVRVLCLATVLLGAPVALAAPSGSSLRAAVGGSVDRGAVNLTLGFRHDVSPRLQLGLSLELNPWVDFVAWRSAPGVASAYATAVWRWVRLGQVELRTSAHLGACMLLFEAEGARAGSVGPYLGLGALGVSFPLGPNIRMDITPAELTLAAPQLQGTPFVYPQYRLSIGLELGI
ncbi:hypothetical protein [Archangium lipolyticum]|uniref:hypothetical protein n=1 Tax=Archangium lipolyticum TaxID=2970465 RepID=UPI002149B8C2|nr:hypothetical protein [Archangium lipolyticum]